jgi:hypothetical protein
MMLHATFALIKHDVLPMDLVAVDTCTGKRMYSFLSFGWGLVSDVDIESERYRSMGNARFTVGAIARVISEHCHSLVHTAFILVLFQICASTMASYLFSLVRTLFLDLSPARTACVSPERLIYLLLSNQLAPSP